MTETPRVLAVDDDPTILRLLKVVLTRAGYQVDTAVNGQEAIERVDACVYDVVLLDLMMPVATGFDVLTRTHACNPLRRFVVITSAASPDMIARAAAFNVFAALRKPFELAALLETVQACAEGRERVFTSLPGLAGVPAPESSVL